MEENRPVYTWKEIIAQLRAAGLDATVQVPAASIRHPLDAGMGRMDSTPEDQRPQYVRVLDARLACHVLVCGDWYHVTLYEYASAQRAQASTPEILDRDDAPVRKRESGSWWLTRLVADHPSLILGGAAVAGACFGVACVPKKKRGEAAAKGGGLGLAVGLAMVAVETANTSPRTAEVAQGLFATLTMIAVGGELTTRVIRPASRASSSSAAGTSPKAQTTAKKKKASHGLPI